ncbi:MAG TPA: SRPBCC family protein [Chitinophagaceae bacterium]|nr:SRPBCC family protein [Chitinophagaceae bacterium]
MAVYSLRTVQRIPVSLEKAWDFFSSPANLQQLTPKDMDFKVISAHHGDRMYPGQIIEYTVKPLLGIPVYWMTEITHVEPHRFFVDEQRFGPYRFWHHQHHFREIPGGVEMTDIVHYSNPLWWLGDLANVLVVRKRLAQIFDYRFRQVEELFGKWPADTAGS